MGFLDDVSSAVQGQQMLVRAQQAVSGAMTPEQQVKIASMVKHGLLMPSFMHWLDTEEGKSAFREFVDKFTG